MVRFRSVVQRVITYRSGHNYVKVFVRKAIYLLLLFIFIVLLRVLVFDFCQVESVSMQETLFAGDVILVNKLQYGARLPRQPGDVPFLEALAYSVGFHSWALNTSWDYRRMPGATGINRNDIMVFTDPHKKENNLIKRCVGLPGDTLVIKHNLRFANGLGQSEPSTAKFSFSIKTKGATLPPDTLKKYGLNSVDILWQKDDYIHLSLTKDEANALKKCSMADTIFINDFPNGWWSDPNLFPFSRSFLFTFENFGPVIIPAKGQTIQLDTLNICFYKEVIMNYEHNQIEVSGSKITINGKVTSSYTFKMNYFFMMGDNRYRSWDSRHWGFVPEFAIVGKVGFILFSYDKEKEGLKKIHADRIFKTID